MYHSFLIHSSADGHLGCFHILAMINSAVNIGVHVSLSILVSSVCMPSSGIAGSYGSSVCSRCFLKEGNRALDGTELLTCGWIQQTPRSTHVLYLSVVYPSTYLPILESESEVAQSCPTLCDPMDCSLPGFSGPGIFQARMLEWVAISFSRESSNPGIEPGAPALRADSLL